MNSKLKIFLLILALLVIVIVLFIPYLWKFDLVAIGDNLYQDLPMRILASNFWKQGKIPLWNPYNFTGQPIAGLVHGGVFYPPNILFCFLPPIIAHKLLIIFSLWWLGVGFLFWALQKKFSFLIAFFISALAITQIIHFIIQPEIRDTIIWLPWMLWAADAIKEKKQKLFKYILINSIIWSLSFLAGHPQFWFYLIITTSIYILLQKGWKKEWIWISIITVFLIMPQVLLALPNYLNSPRINTEFCKMNFNQPSIKLIINTFLCFIIPFNSNQLDFKVFYFSPLLFSLCLSIFFFKTNSLKFYKSLFISNLFFSIITAFTFFTCYIPLFQSFRFHQRYLQSIMLYIILICAMAVLDYCLKNKKNLLPWFITTLSLIFISSIFSFWLNKFKENIWKIFTSIEYLFFILIFIVSIKKMKELDFKYKIIIPIFFIIFLQYKFAYNKFLYTYKLASNIWQENLNYYEKIKEIKINKIYSHLFPFPDSKSGLEPLLNTVHKVNQLNFIGDIFFPSIKKDLRILFSYNPKIWNLFGASYYLEPAKVIEAYKKDKNKIIKFNFERLKKEKNWQLIPPSVDPRIPSMLLIHQYLEKSPNWKIIRKLEHPNIIIYENKGKIFPNAWLINKTVFVNSEDEFINMLIKKPIKFWENIGVVNSKRLEYSLPENKDNKLFIVKWEADNVFIKTNVNHYRILVVRIYPYPCWNAKIDNYNSRIFPINFVMQGILVPPGKHNIILSCTFKNLLKNILTKRIILPKK